jgi:LPS export ABC transporter protein LptC
MLFRIFTVLAVIALAISTWILSSPGHRPKQTAGGAQAELPGYYLKNTVLTDFDAAGKPSLRVDAERIDQIANSSEVALSNVRMNYLTPAGQAWVMFGDIAHVRPGGKVIDVTGNVRLQNEVKGNAPAAIVRSDSMSYDVPDAIATTKDDVRIDFGVHTLTAHGLVANLKERTMRLESRVNGRFQP